MTSPFPSAREKWLGISDQTARESHPPSKSSAESSHRTAVCAASTGGFHGRTGLAHVKDIGVVFGQRTQLWWDVPVIDSYELLKDIYSISEDTYQANLEELTSLLNLSELLKTPARQLSLGQRMRCEIAASLLHSPKILFLDEPTIGLDAVSKLAVRDFIVKCNEKYRTTVILTTHDMQDIEALTDRIILIGKGKNPAGWYAG